ncbi:hypothetical protein [Endomicrobium proavitum]|uniref:FlgD Ig-like domain-containing protein n=1 Tax=Endomicrobium proavitum TaxID=1408281 RepID=A0A0G3WJK0_9BACT|nr:hypothetical protein [Endomicrobium proavitum]AKL98055.1 exported protein of unknown function [Endomicrobium proavitum]
MNKILRKSLLLTFVLTALFTAANAFAVVGQGFSTVTVSIMFLSSGAPVSASTVTIQHAAIDRISVNMRALVATGTVHIEGSANLTNLELQYWREKGSSTETVNVRFIDVGGKNYSFVTPAVNVPQQTPGNEDAVHYRIVAQSDNGEYGYYPSSSSWQKAGLHVSTSHVIDAAGGRIVLNSGDQVKGNTSLSFQTGVLSGGQSFSIEELYSDGTPLYSLVPVIAYRFLPVTYSTAAAGSTITMYYGHLPSNANNINVMYHDGASAQWQNVAILNNNTDAKTVTVSLDQVQRQLGYYAIVNGQNVSDNDHRPTQRALMPGETISFRNLHSGDSVTIFNMRAKIIRTLSNIESDGSIIWDGKDSGGNFVETGTYIYQMKVNGKIISGTLAFIR